ncbi:hypothetical protein DPMN_136659 [Dreissena polymorpha]|uniref:Uncharacterized protein n=1 Tax=Dreissena polymorpha TaxID=45954 RepID=A0A9D4G169_DREPO|nr:hypothetical protein DPMN_136659 [Dreissena polymorpha]
MLVTTFRVQFLPLFRVAMTTALAPMWTGTAWHCVLAHVCILLGRLKPDQSHKYERLKPDQSHKYRRLKLDQSHKYRRLKLDQSHKYRRLKPDQSH